MAIGIELFAQMSVTGNVTDKATGEPLAGVSVAVQGTTRGVITDIDGRFIADVPADASLIFGYLGYRTVTVPVDGHKVLDVVMESDINTLDEVVLMGYSSMKKTELSSSVVSVQGDKLRDIVTPDIGTMLQGKVAGVVVTNSSGAPGSGATIRIRGTGSIAASSDPLYVVDGVVGGTFSPNDVETITVLKDAGSTGIYGASGAGGVIVVTTKQARNGQEPTVDFKAQVGVKQLLTGRFHMMNASELYDFYASVRSKTSMKSYPETLREQNFDWIKDAERTGLTQNYYLSASGSLKKMSFLVSLDYYDEDGTQRESRYNRLSGRVNVGAEIVKNVTLNARVNYSQSKTVEGTGLGCYNQLPWNNPYDQNTGKYMYLSSAVRPDNGQIWYGREAVNPLYAPSVNPNPYGISKSFVGDLWLSWAITDYLTVTSTNRYSTGSSLYKSVVVPEAYNATWPDGKIGQDISWGNSFCTTDILKYFDTFSDAHGVSILAGYEYGYSSDEYMNAIASGLKNGLQVLNGTVAENIYGTKTETASWSVFAQAQYSYMEKYILNATFRADASSVFAPKNRVGYFPSVSAAWLVSGENFMKNQNVISFLKIRASYGMTGNSGIGAYKYLDLYGFSDKLQYQGVQGAVPMTVANPYLHWETAVMKNLGIDISFGNYLTFNVDLYSNLNKDLLLSVPLALSSGFDSRTENTGKIRNSGVEVQLTSNNFNRRNFKWSTSVNLGHNKNVVVYLPDHKDIVVSHSQGDQIYREGEPLYSWYMPKWVGVDPENGNPLWEQLTRDEDGNIISREPGSTLNMTRDVQIVGCAQPKLTGGMLNTFNVYGVEISANLQFVYGNDVYNETRRYIDSDGAYIDYNFMSIDNGLGWSRWEKEGDIATHPKAKVGGNRRSNELTSRYLEDGSYLRIKNVTISYPLPSKVTKKMRMQSFRIFLSGDNLYTFTKFSGMDPEVGVKGLFSYNYPVSRAFSLGLNIKF
ncbi:MAG: SusC/RagA family TonB-linked outer membrane protein [Bacteroidales bacterium]|nr:SusC/RagA family TonB-linked outer membrane protein [Bacteroidales bacterium]